MRRSRERRRRRESSRARRRRRERSRERMRRRRRRERSRERMRRRRERSRERRRRRRWKSRVKSVCAVSEMINTLFSPCTSSHWGGRVCVCVGQRERGGGVLIEDYILLNRDLLGEASHCVSSCF